MNEYEFKRACLSHALFVFRTKNTYCYRNKKQLKERIIMLKNVIVGAVQIAAGLVVGTVAAEQLNKHVIDPLEKVIKAKKGGSK